MNPTQKLIEDLRDMADIEVGAPSDKLLLYAATQLESLSAKLAECQAALKAIQDFNMAVILKQNNALELARKADDLTIKALSSEPSSYVPRSELEEANATIKGLEHYHLGLTEANERAFAAEKERDQLKQDLEKLQCTTKHFCGAHIRQVHMIVVENFKYGCPSCDRDSANQVIIQLHQQFADSEYVG